MTETTQVDPGLAAEARSSHSPIEAARQHADHQAVMDGRRKFNSHLEDHVLDYFHNNPANIEACLTTCVKLFSNIVNNPTEEKYRKVKASSATLKSTVMVVKGGEDLLLHAGWVPRVIELEKFWIFDANPDSIRFGVLKEALHLTERALATVHEKAEKLRKQREEKLAKESAEKERIRLAIEEDKAERRQRAELAAAAAASPPKPTPSSVTSGGARKAGAGSSPARRSPPSTTKR